MGSSPTTVGLGELVCLCRLLLQHIRVVKDSSIYCHGNWSSIPQLQGGSCHGGYQEKGEQICQPKCGLLLTPVQLGLVREVCWQL